MNPLPSKNPGRYRIVAEINMIPLIDVSLVLLIIFMVMTPFLVRSQIRVNLPKARATDPLPQQEQSIEVQVDKAGQVFVNGQRVEKNGIEAALKRVVTDPAKQPVVIQADKETQFEHIVGVMSAAKSLGVAKLGVSVKPDGKTPAGAGRTPPRSR